MYALKKDGINSYMSNSDKEGVAPTINDDVDMNASRSVMQYLDQLLHMDICFTDSELRGLAK